tara:strand:- start:144 stop:2240 length:2097 start_codon:yes stop_codon:yes gene_type:complete
LAEKLSINLNTDIKFLKGVGPQRASILNQNNIKTINDLIRYYPRKYLDRTNIKKIREVKIGEKAVIIAKVKSFSMKRTKKNRYFQVTIADDSGGYINCMWFNSLSWITDKFKIGDNVALFGKIEFYQSLRIIHPEFDILDESDDPINTGCIVPLYSSNNLLKKVGLDSRGIRKLILKIFKELDQQIFDYFDIKFLKKEGLLNLYEALYKIHIPQNNNDVKNAIYRLKFDEHFFLQLLKALSKKKQEEIKGKSFKNLGDYTKPIYKNLNFNLTNSQIEVLREIRSDFKSTKPMNRLIQGDVGCGKTIVAVLAGSIIVGNGAQVAIMAPTEILAEQHYKTFQKYFKNFDIKCDLLISNITKKEKEKIYSNLQNGAINIIVGTHALIQENVSFYNLGLAIIDEQHKFGVDQRKKLIQKGKDPNILAMTATPIPRTLAFTIHGEMEISWINEMPSNRKKIVTSKIYGENINDIYNKMKLEMDKGNHCYIVYPIISESEKIDAKDAETAYLNLKKNEFKNYKLGFMHGKLKKDEKEILMNNFIKGEINCLISTTVVEVGIDDPKATIMVIENAERFGLTQLHQLRGRIGRGELQSHCYLIQRKQTPNSEFRLGLLERTSDGFKIADEDLKLRGPGDFFGTKQHGYVKLGLINFYSDGPIIKRARMNAFDIIDEDPNLMSSRNVLIKNEFLKNYKNMLEFINIG